MMKQNERSHQRSTLYNLTQTTNIMKIECQIEIESPKFSVIRKL